MNKTDQQVRIVAKRVAGIKDSTERANAFLSQLTGALQATGQASLAQVVWEVLQPGTNASDD